MTDVTSITFEIGGNIAVVGGLPGTGASYDLSKDGDTNIEIINQRPDPVTVNLVSVENFPTGNIILKSDGTGTGTIIINGDKNNTGTNIEITRAGNGHSLFKMDSTNPPDMINVSIKNVKVSIANDFILDQLFSGGILSIFGLLSVNKEIVIENCNLSVPNGTIKNEENYCGGIIGYPAGAEDGQEAKFTIKNCSVTAKNITANDQSFGGILGCGSAFGSGEGILEIEGCNVNVTEDFKTKTDGNESGGIMGCSTIKTQNGDATLKIKNCTVTAKTITADRSNTGGIIGVENIIRKTVAGDTNVGLEISGCTVEAKTSINFNRNDSGGIISLEHFGYSEFDSNVTLNIKKCTVKAKTSINFNGTSNGGIIGMCCADSSKDVTKAHLNIHECFVEATESISINNDYNGIIVGFGSSNSVNVNSEIKINISNCIATCRKGSLSSNSENSGSIIGYRILRNGATIDIKNCLIQFCKEFSFEGLPTITSSLNVNDANKEYVIRGEITNGGTVNVTNNEISTLCNFDVGIIPGISPQLLQTTQGGSARSNSRLILRRTGFNQQMKNQFKDWNQNPKVPKVSQGERLRWLKLLAKNKDYNVDKL